MRCSTREAARRGGYAAAALGVIVALSACSGIPGLYTVETSSAAAGTGSASEAFNATSFAEGIWASKVIPTAQSKAVDASDLFGALQADSAAASQKYGRQAGSGAPFTFLVKGSGTVSAVSKGDAVGSITVTVAGVNGTEVRLAVGPAFVGTALRDSMDFIDFSQFTNQLDYAAAATALNGKVKNTVVKGLDLSTITGKKVEFVGAFALLDPKSALIVPITLTVS